MEKGHQGESCIYHSWTVQEKKFIGWDGFCFPFVDPFPHQTIFRPPRHCVLSSVLTLGPNIGVHQPLQPLHNIPMRSLVCQQYLN